MTNVYENGTIIQYLKIKMTIDYSKIKNQKLVEIIQKSPSLDFLPDDLKQRYIDSIVNLSETEKEALIKSIEEQGSSTNQMSNEERIAAFEKAATAIKELMVNFNKDIRVEKEKIDNSSSEKEQERLLNEISTI